MSETVREQDFAPAQSERRARIGKSSKGSPAEGPAIILRSLSPVCREASGLERVTVESRGDVATLGAWAAAFSGQYKDRRYYEIVEETLHPEFRYRYFVLWDRAGQPRAIQPFFVLDQDILAGASGRMTAAVEYVRKRWPKFLSLRTLMVGCVAGEGHLDGPEVFADPMAPALLAQAALEEARKEKAGLIVFKEFPAMYREVLGSLGRLGFIKLPSLPMSSLNIAYESFDEYLTKALSRATRKDLRRKFKTAQGAALSLSVEHDITPFIDEVYPLYLEVYKRSKLHFEKLTKEYLCELGRRMPDKIRFFIWRTKGKIVAFNLCMVHEDAIYDQYIGLDYAVALDLHLYHYTFRDIMNWAIDNGYRWYRSNGLNYDPKLHLRMQLDPLDLYVRHRSPAANAVMKILLPWLEPTQYDKHLKKFPNYHELRC
ncbi:MAG: GNAT family N-acetyltransferase [Rhodomicrobium sp.]|nr:GNAT family N-acetyltransferase [Rhodomicrobium sp.]